MKNFIKKHFAFLISLGLCLLCYWPIILWMWDRWFARDSYYTHGILVPFVTIYLIWQKRELLKKTIIKPNLWGVALILTGILFHIGASLFRVYFVSGFSILLVLFGLVIFFFGLSILKIIWLPMFFLIFMIPLPMIIITGISFRMKLLAAKIATGVLHQIRIPAMREGSMIYMPHAYVVVDDVCSGLRSLISLTALGSVFAYMSSTIPLKKWIIFLSTIPIAIVTNVIRVVILASVSEIWGSKYAMGAIHDISGFSVFVLAFILLFAVGRALE